MSEYVSATDSEKERSGFELGEALCVELEKFRERVKICLAM